MIRIIFLVFFSLLASQSDLMADEASQMDEIEGQVRRPIKSIVISGNDRTKESVILREARLKDGDFLRDKDIEEVKHRIKKLGLFSEVGIKFRDSGELLIDVEEKWTTIPIFKVASGGGVTQLTLGVYDPNVFGRYVEMGSQFTKLGDTQSGVAWFKNPRLFGSRHGIDLQYWETNRLRTKYNQEADDPDIKTGFLHQREMVYAAYAHEFSDYFILDTFYEYNNDTFSDEFVSDEVLPFLQATGLPPDSEVSFFGVKGKYDDIKYTDFIGEGFAAEVSYKYGFSSTKNLKNFGQFDLTGYFHKKIDAGLGFAQRLMSGVTSTEILQYWHYLGGLDRIRGFSDNRFAGRYYLLSNSEIRYNIWQKPLWIVQGVGFVDLVSVGESERELTTLMGASLGAGLRIILPKIYRFVLRLDYAQPVHRDDDMNFSFGLQQFF